MQMKSFTLEKEFEHPFFFFIIVLFLLLFSNKLNLTGRISKIPFLPSMLKLIEYFFLLLNMTTMFGVLYPLFIKMVIVK